MLDDEISPQKTIEIKKLFYFNQRHQFSYSLQTNLYITLKISATNYFQN